MSILLYILCGIGSLMMLLAGIVLHKIGTIRKWQLDDKNGG